MIKNSLLPSSLQRGRQKGQALLIVIVALTIALTIGINASVRTITSLSRTSRTDTASRALAAAEGGIERFLVLSKDDLDDAVSGSCPSLPNIADGSFNGVDGCVVSFGAVGDNIEAEAFVTVEEHEPEDYHFAIESGEVREINLAGYAENDDVKLCWRPVSGADIAFNVYSSRGPMLNVLLRGNNPPAGNYAASGVTNAEASIPAGAPYDNCYDISFPNVGIFGDPYGLRVRSVGGDSNVGVYAATGETLPLQGYKIVSIGKLVQDSNVTAARKIRVIRTLPYLPAPFDFSYYSVQGITK